MTRIGSHHSSGSFCWRDIKTRTVGESAEFFAAAMGGNFHFDNQSWRPRTMVSVEGRDIASVSDLSAPVYPANAEPHVAMYLAVDDVDLAVERAGRAGATILVEPFAAGDEGVIATLLDPCGAAVSLWQRNHNMGWCRPSGSIGAPTGLFYCVDATLQIEDFYRHALDLIDPSARFVTSDDDTTQPEWMVSLAATSFDHVASDITDVGGVVRKDLPYGENLVELSNQEGLRFLVEEIPIPTS